MRLAVKLSLLLLPFSGMAKDVPSDFLPKNDLSFIENRGQITDQYGKLRSDIDFSLSSKDVTVFLGNGELHYQFSKLRNTDAVKHLTTIDALQPNKKSEDVLFDMYRMDVSLVGANSNASIVKEDITPSSIQYVKLQESKGFHNRATQLISSSFKKITYKSIYPKIDWVIYINGAAVEYEFIVHPGGNPSNIKIKYDGASSLKINEDGSLTAKTPMGEIREKAPYSFQENKKEVRSSYKLTNNIISFNLDPYNGTLVIDPTLTWGTYFGGTAQDEYKKTSIDASGNIYAAGWTLSTSNIATSGAFQTLLSGGTDMILSKFTSNGGLIWSTYVGTTSNDIAFAMTLSGNDVFIGGYTAILGNDDALVVKFNSSGVYVDDAIIGDIGVDRGVCLAATSTGDIFFSGLTSSSSGITTTGAYQSTYGGGALDGFVMKLTNNIASVYFITYYGGSGEDAILAMDLDASGNAYLAGYTQSTNGIATVTTPSFGGITDGFVSKFNSTGTRQWGAYTGGNGIDQIEGLSVDASGNVYGTGTSTSSSGIATAGAYQTTNQGGAQNLDAILAKYNSSGAKQWATYFGGNGDDFGYCIATAGSNVYFAGITQSTNLIATAGAHQSTSGGLNDSYMAKFSSTGTITWGTYYGGSGDDWIRALSLDATNNLLVGGLSSSTSAIATPGAQQTLNNGGGDALLAKFVDCQLPSQPSAITGPTSVCANTNGTFTIPPVTGATSYTWTLPSGFTGSSTTNSINVTIGSTGGVVSVQANNTCGPSAAATITVTVVPIPVATIAVTGSTSICPGDSVTLQASPLGFNYQWQLNSINIPNATNSFFAAKVNGNYRVIVNGGAGCADTSAPETVTLLAAPATPTISSNSPVCAGQPINLSASTTTSGVSYIWAGPGGFLSTVQNPVINNATSSNAGLYAVVIDLNGCIVSASTTVIVTSGAPTTPVAINGTNTACIGTTQTYSVPNDPSVASYSWILPSGWSGTSTTNSITLTVGNNSGSIGVIATNGCGSSGQQNLAVTTVPKPTVTISQAGNTLSASGVFTSYQWYFNGALIPGATTQSYTFTQNGNYYVEVSNGTCSAQSNVISAITSVASIPNLVTLSLYPNPNSGLFTISARFDKTNQYVDLTISTIDGRVSKRQHVSMKSTVLDLNVDVSDLSAGAYFIDIRTELGHQTLPFVKK